MIIDKEINLEKIISEFLSVIDFKLCSLDNNSITIQDLKNSQELNQILNLPIDFTSNDDLRVFRSNKLSNDAYHINVLNTKYHKVPFSKNGIESFYISIRKKASHSNFDDVFSSEIFHNDNLYNTLIGKDSSQNYLCYAETNDTGVIEVNYILDNNNRKLEITSHLFQGIDHIICINENISNDNHNAVLLVKENNQEVFKRELKNNEIEDYFKTLAYKSKSIVEPANNVIKILNNNIYEIVFNYYDIATEFVNLINNGNKSNEIIEELFEIYFSNTSLNHTTETEIPHVKKLIPKI